MTTTREQVVAALAGAYFPKVGDVGRYEESLPTGWRMETVLVVQVSDTGKTVWLAFEGSARDTRRGVAWRRCGRFDRRWWAPWPRSALPGSPRVQLPAPKSPDGWLQFGKP